jgi:hypothetical protein
MHAERRLPAPTLELNREAKIHDILGDTVSTRLEASGVLAKDGAFYVIFDNVADIARLGPELRPGMSNRVIRQPRGHTDNFESDGFEDIAYDLAADRFFILIEALPRGSHTYMAKVQEYDSEFRYLRARWLNFPLDQANKGLEGLTCAHRGGRTYLLGLCEGNRCKGGAAGRQPGGGRIQIFEEADEHWEHVGTIRLPTDLWFIDYSSIAVAGNRVAVLSQESSALWVGAFEPSGWGVIDGGRAYELPRDGHGEAVYRYAEGVSWLDDDHVVVVSDKAKAGHPAAPGGDKDQSIHVFALPGRPAPPFHARP